MLDVLVIAALLVLWPAAAELFLFAVCWLISKRSWAVREFVDGPLDGTQMRLPRRNNFFAYFMPIGSPDGIGLLYRYRLRKGRFVLQRLDRLREPRPRPEDEEEISVPSS